MIRRSRIPHLLVLATLGLTVAACGTLRANTAASRLGGMAAAARSKSAVIDPVRALNHVRFFTGDDLAGRMTASKGDQLADDYIMAEFQKLGLYVTKQAFTSSAFAGPANNVIAMLPGSERASSHYVVIGAHKDHLGKKWGQTYWGANDNAGGTAAVLEIARVMVDRTQSAGDRPRSNILFMTFSGEELGLIGSKFYTKHPIAPTEEGDARPITLDAINGMVNLDCIAVGKTDSLGTDSVNDAETRTDLTAIAARRGMKTVFKPFAVPEGPTGSNPGHVHTDEKGRPLPPGASSDHASFRAAGVKSVCYYAEPVFSKYLHTPYDTIPERDTVKKDPADRFNVDNLVRIAGVALDTAYAWSNGAISGR